jgi:L-lactate dehydrogenase (cytochrome)
MLQKVLSHRIFFPSLKRFASNKYPPSMELGDDFYDRLFNEVKTRRDENMKLYPPKDALMSILPQMGNIDNHQFGIYWDGVYGKLPQLPVDPDLLLNKFVNEADPDCVIWLLGRAGNKSTYFNNTSDFENWRIVPRMLQGVSSVDSSVKFRLGEKEVTWKYPIGIAPVGVQDRVSFPKEKGDILTAIGAAQCEIPMCVSSVSSTSLESISESIKNANSNAPAPWFQLYNSNVPEISKSLLSRAKKSGYGAVVVTVDTSKYGYRTEELDAGYFPQVLAN